MHGAIIAHCGNSSDECACTERCSGTLLPSLRIAAKDAFAGPYHLNATRSKLEVAS